MYDYLMLRTLPKTIKNCQFWTKIRTRFTIFQCKQSVRIKQLLRFFSKNIFKCLEYQKILNFQNSLKIINIRPQITKAPVIRKLFDSFLPTVHWNVGICSSYFSALRCRHIRKLFTCENVQMRYQ